MSRNGNDGLFTKGSFYNTDRSQVVVYQSSKVYVKAIKQCKVELSMDVLKALKKVKKRFLYNTVVKFLFSMEKNWSNFTYLNCIKSFKILTGQIGSQGIVGQKSILVWYDILCTFIKQTKKLKQKGFTSNNTA